MEQTNQQQPTANNSEEFLQKYNIELPQSHADETKALFLVVVSIVFALIAFISLFFGLKIKNKSDLYTLEQREPEPTQVTEPEKTYDPKEFDIQFEIEKLDELNLEDFEETYSKEAL